MSSVIVSVRVPKELREELKKYGVNVSQIVRKALEEEVKRRRIEELKEAAGRLGELFANIQDEAIVEAIRRMRDER